MAYKVYELKNNYEIKYVILSEDEFEETSLCETFDNYGQKVECYEVGCYCLANLESTFGGDMAKDFKWNPEIMEQITDLEELEERLIDHGIDYDMEKLKKYLAENEEHVSCKAYNYWDGSNHQTLLLESDLDFTDLEEVEPELECKILEAFKSFSTYIEKGSEKTEEIDGFTFFYSRMSGFVFEAAILNEENITYLETI